jgi:hypothetical protein
VFGSAGTVLSCHCQETVSGVTVGINEGFDYTGNFAKGDALISQPFISDR